MKITLIGCGVMGQALARHLSKKQTLVLCDRNEEKIVALAQELKCHAELDAQKAVLHADLIILAIKPKNLESLVKSISTSSDQTVLSILAGTSLATLKKGFPKSHLVRTMPNLALTTGKGMMGIVDEKSVNKKMVTSLFEDLGYLVWLPENQIDAFTSLTASGPAFFLVFLESMIEAGITLGFPYPQSRELSMKTVEGAIALLESSGKHPEELKLNIASPAGMTIAGLNEMEKTPFRAAVISAFMAAYERCKELNPG